MNGVNRQEFALTHPVRQMLYAELRRNPGLRLHQLGRIVGQQSASVKWHLRVLERARMIESHVDGALRFYTLYGIHPDDVVVARALALVRDSIHANVLRHVAGGEATTAGAAAKATAASTATARSSLETLVTAGLARREQPDPAGSYVCTPLGRRVAPFLV